MAIANGRVPRDLPPRFLISASRFALEVNKAAATGDLHPAIAALGEVTAQCVACHAAYRLH